MENTEIKSGAKEVKNQIVLKNLTKRQKELLSSAGVIFGGIGLGAGLFSLYSMGDPTTIPAMQNPEVEESLHANIGDDTAITNLIHPQEEQNEPVILLTKNPVQEMNDENGSFSEAFNIARSINGPGGWFIWKDNVYNSFYKEEWEVMKPSERNEYLASIEVQGTSEPMPPVANAEMIAEPIIEPATEEQEDLTKVEIIAEPVIETATEEQEDLTKVEIITLDDETDLKQQGVFELYDDVEITVLTTDEANKLDSIVIDSTQITEFPWGETVQEVNDSVTEIDATPIIVNEETQDELTAVADTPEVDEYPWGEPMERKEPIIDNSLSDNDIASNDSIHPIITDPKAITEYPWGEPVGSENVVEAIGATGIAIDSTLSVDVENPLVSKFEDIEEFPWGEKNIQYKPFNETMPAEMTGEILHSESEGENVGLIVNNDIEPIFRSQLPPSFSDVTEFPWGESILDSQIGLNEDTANGDDTLLTP